MIDKVTTIENKILELKKKKERLQTQQALLLMKEAQKVLKEEFSPNLSITILKESWSTASKTQKAEWKTRAISFPVSASKVHKKTQNHSSATEQSRKEEIPHHEHS